MSLHMISCLGWNFCLSWVYISNRTVLVIVEDENAAGRPFCKGGEKVRTILYNQY